MNSMFDSLPLAIMRHPRISAACGVILLLLAGSFIWWQFIWQQPQRVFTDMLANNLATPSVTKTAAANGNGESVTQNVRLQMGGTNAADWIVSATQTNSSVTTESIGTPTTGYIRYLHIAARQAVGSKPYNFSQVLDVWGKSDGKIDPSLNHLFNQTVLDISNAPLPPIGNLPDSARQNLLAYMQRQSIFVPSYATVKRQTIQGRSVYTYSVAVHLGAYIRMMQAFAHDLHMADLDTVDPSQYSTVPPITLTISVDRVSHELSQVSYPGSGFSQSYTSWGVLSPIILPSKVITTTALQSRIQALSAGPQV
jgi:hypothetical protein